jgi:protein SCO1/2
VKALPTVFALLLVSAGVAALPPPVPGDSLYQLKIELAAQDGRRVRLDELRGRPVLIAMFYASCAGVCPAIAFNMRRMDAALTPAQRESLQPVMVSFDPARDDAAALTEFARLNKLDAPRWIVARTPESSVRELAAALGVRYRQLPDGTFSHSTVIAVLDADGVIRARTETISAVDPAFMQVLSTISQKK